MPASLCPASLRRLRDAALTIAALLGSACSGSTGDMSTGPSTGPGPGTQPPAASIAGIFRLHSVNGNPLGMPWETDGAFANYFTSGEIELKPNGEFERTLRGRTVIPQMDDIVYDRRWNGTYVFHPSAPGEDDGRLTLRSDNGDTDEMDITELSIIDENPIPGVNGGEQVLLLLYFRD